MWPLVVGVLIVWGASMLLGLATLSFWQRAFELGPRLLTQEVRDLSPLDAKAGVWHETKHWVIKTVATDRILARPRYSPFAMYIAPLTATLSWANGPGTLCIRMQLSVAAAGGVWLLFATVIGVASMLEHGASAGALMFTLVSWALVGFMVGMPVAVRKSEARSLVAEYLLLEERLESDAQQAPPADSAHERID